MTMDKDHYEIIVINNNSTDDTQKIVEDFAQKEPNIRFFIEPKQGLSNARNRGWKEARGKYIAYIDDDCKVPAQWLSIAKKITDRKSPGAFGGPYLAFYNTPKPLWFKDAYGSHIQGNDSHPLQDNEYLDGGNIFLRRSLLQDIGGFNVFLGMSGKKIAYGEETALLRSIRASRPDQLIYYDPRLYVYHLVQAKKMDLPWIMRERFAHGRYAYRVFSDNNCTSNTKIGLRKLLFEGSLVVLDFGIDLSRGFFNRDRKKYPYIQNYLFEHTFLYLERLGCLYEQYLLYGV